LLSWHPTETTKLPTESSTGSGGSGGEGRRPVVIDLPAEEVRKPAATGADAGEPAIEAPLGAAEPSSNAGQEPAPDAAAAAAEAVIPSALAGAHDDHTEPPARPARARGGASFLALLVAALLGGLVGAGGLLAVDRLGYLDGVLGDRQQPALSAELANLRSEIEELRAAAQGGADVAPLQQQVAGLEQAIAELRSQPAAGGDAAAVSDVQARLAALEQATSDAGAGGNNAALESRLGELASEIEALRSGAGAGTSEPALAAIAARIDEVAGRLGSLEGQSPVDLSGLETEVAEVREQVAQLAGRVDDLPTAERVAALETSLSDTNEQLSTTAAQVETAASLGAAVAADALAAALDAGRPFVTELEALRGLGLDEATLAALAPNAESGLATLGELRSRFENEVAQIDLRSPVPQGTGTFERLLQSARGLVEVRPANPTEGSDPGAVVARVRGALAAGDLRAALAEWNGLPDDVKARTVDWARAAEARLAADDLVAKLRSEALSRLAREG
jgi:hypothetical protein